MLGKSPETKDMEGRSAATTAMAVVILGLHVLLAATPGQAVPIDYSRISWDDSAFLDALSPPSSCNGEDCWSWIRGREPRGDSRYSRDDTADRIQVHLEPWKFPSWNTGGRSGLSAISSRLSKKDVFVSRGWGAGGMPFSVLYMNPHNPRNNFSGPAASGTGIARALPLEGSPPSIAAIKHPNYRITLRNGANGQSRKQYSIIPQLFVSYGWGPLGK